MFHSYVMDFILNKTKQRNQEYSKKNGNTHLLKKMASINVELLKTCKTLIQTQKWMCVYGKLLHLHKVIIHLIRNKSALPKTTKIFSLNLNSISSKFLFAYLCKYLKNKGKNSQRKQ